MPADPAAGSDLVVDAGWEAGLIARRARFGARGGRNIRMEDALHGRDVLALTSTADRLDAMADTAELMGDAAGADRFRERACGYRLRAMKLLDD